MAMSYEPNNLPAADGRKVRVLYTYEYFDDDEKVWMNEGEIFVLLNSSGSEWWQVCRPHNPQQSFYVPTTYVEILEEGNGTIASDPSPLNQGYYDKAHIPVQDIEHQNNDTRNNNVKGMSTFKSPMEMNLDNDSTSASIVYSKRDSDEEDYVNSASYRKGEENGASENFEVKYIHSDARSDSLNDGGDYANLEEFRALAGLPPQQSPQSPDSDYANLQDLHLQEPEPPSIDDCEYKMPLSDEWDVFLDPVSNRMFYVHKQTHQTQWKPPRGQYHREMMSKREGQPTSPSKSPDSDPRTTLFAAPPAAQKGPSGPPRGQVSDRFAKSRSVMIENLQFNAPPISTGQPPPKSATLPPNFSTPFTESEPIEGTLNKCKIMNGKKVSKKWSYSFVKLHGSNLVFYKDQKSAQPKGNQPHGKYDEMVPLGTCSVEKNPKEYTSKKNVILLTSPDYQLLLQAEDDRRLSEWFLKIHMKIEELGGTPTKNVSELSPPSPAATGVDRKPSFKGSKHKRSPSETGTLERKGKIQEILTKFMSSRSEKKDLVKKGIYKDAVFGADLKTICEREKSKVPVFITQCVASIEKHGLDHEGIYRIGGNISTIQKLRCMVDQGEVYDLDNTELWDVNILTGCLKLFFRELKEPLFTYPLFDKYLKSFLKESATDRLKGIKSNMKELPPCNYETVKFLFKHLTAVIEQSLANKMQAHQLAIVFGPTLIWPEKQTQHLATSMVYQSRIVEYILLEYNNIFR